MEQNPIFQQHLNEAKLLFEQGQDAKGIETILLKKGIESQHLDGVLKQIKRSMHAKRSKTGVQLIIAGVLLLGLGFIASIVLHLNGSNSLDFPLYGLTAIGATILIIGLVFIFH